MIWCVSALHLWECGIELCRTATTLQIQLHMYSTHCTYAMYFMLFAVILYCWYFIRYIIHSKHIRIMLRMLFVVILYLYHYYINIVCICVYTWLKMYVYALNISVRIRYHTTIQYNFACNVRTYVCVDVDVYVCDDDVNVSFRTLVWEVQ